MLDCGSVFIKVWVGVVWALNDEESEDSDEEDAGDDDDGGDSDVWDPHDDEESECGEGDDGPVDDFCFAPCGVFSAAHWIWCCIHSVCSFSDCGVVYSFILHGYVVWLFWGVMLSSSRLMMRSLRSRPLRVGMRCWCVRVRRWSCSSWCISCVR